MTKPISSPSRLRMPMVLSCLRYQPNRMRPYSEWPACQFHSHYVNLELYKIVLAMTIFALEACGELILMRNGVLALLFSLPLAVFSVEVRANDLSPAQKRAFANACLQQYRTTMSEWQRGQFCECYAERYTRYVDINDHLLNERTGKMPPRMWESIRLLSVECIKNAGI